MNSARPALPRLNFSGRFFADVSTVNNDIRHYDVDSFRPNYQYPQDESNRNGWWNPEGTGTFSLISCKVNSIQIPGSSVPSIIEKDPLQGVQITGNNVTVQGKMVDLDPQMQFLSQIFGVRMTIKANNVTTEGGEVSGDMLSGQILPCAFRDIWSSLEGGQHSGGMGAVYQSILKLDLLSVKDSKFLQECEEYIGSQSRFKNGAMSIRFRTANYITDSQKDDFRYGDIIGFIQPWLPTEPDTFYSGRIMKPVDDKTANSAYFYYQESSDNVHSIFVDLCNTLIREKGNKYKNIGQLHLCVFPNGYDPSNLCFKSLGEISYLAGDWDQRYSAVAEVTIPAAKVSDIESLPLGLVAIKPEGDETQTVLVVEANDGLFVKADLTFMRLNFGQEEISNIYVTKFGKRQSDHTVLVGLDSSSMYVEDGPLPGTPVDGIIVNGETPPDAKFQISLTTNGEGVAEVKVKGGDPKNARKYIDGQVYGLRYSGTETLPPLNPNASPSDNVNVLVFDNFIAPKKASWVGDILPIFKQYANLYPSMHRVVKLDDYGSVLDRRISLMKAFGASEDEAHYMPVTRDLSAAKREMIVEWLEDIDEKGRPLFMDTMRKSDLMTALQMAVELEHATIPPYLTALYSIKPGTNEYIADSIREVVDDEMTHIAMASNILISIGGRPIMNKIGFVPKYPGPLPGGLRKGLRLRLRKCCKEQIFAFMELEAPEKELLEEDGVVKGTIIPKKKEKNPFTIGFVYNKIIEALTNLHDDPELPEDEKIRFPDDDNLGPDDDNVKFQVVDAWPDKVKLIRNLEDAIAAIEKIKDEGEGASPTKPFDDEEDAETGLKQLAHYFRFSEIYNGRRIVMKKRSFSYSGPAIEMDEDGIYNMQDDPNLKFLPKGSKARLRMEAFSRHYKSLLNALHITFNGKSAYLRQAVALMFQLTIFAQPLMEMPAVNADGSPKNDGTTVGISFQLPFDDDDDE